MKRYSLAALSAWPIGPDVLNFRIHIRILVDRLRKVTLLAYCEPTQFLAFRSNYFFEFFYCYCMNISFQSISGYAFLLMAVHIDFITLAMSETSRIEYPLLEMTLRGQ